MHKVPLRAGGARVVLDGLAPLAGKSTIDYFRSLKGRFPLANAVRVRGCSGRITGRARSSYCPECRLALQEWCRVSIASQAPEAWLARLMLHEIFRDQNSPSM